MIESIDPLHQVKVVFHNEVKRYKNGDSTNSQTALAIAKLYQAIISGKEYKDQRKTE